jgi:hypothetical protein
MIDWRMELRYERESDDKDFREGKNFVVTIVLNGGETVLTTFVD